MKKILFIILIFCFGLSSLSKTQSVQNIKTLQFDVEEKLMINNKERLTEYNIIFELPDKIQKKIIYPELNKGELYTYIGNKKTIYLPIFDEKKEEIIESQENEIISILKELIELEKKDKIFKEKYYKKIPQRVTFKNNTNILIEKYSDVDNYIIPDKIIIRNEEDYVGELKLRNIKVNFKIEPEIFSN